MLNLDDEQMSLSEERDFYKIALAGESGPLEKQSRLEGAALDGIKIFQVAVFETAQWELSSCSLHSFFVRRWLAVSPVFTTYMTSQSR